MNFKRTGIKSLLRSKKGEMAEWSNELSRTRKVHKTNMAKH